MATYRYYDDQPDQEILRDNERWAQWATETGVNMQES
jgi:hypothetical protein